MTIEMLKGLRAEMRAMNQAHAETNARPYGLTQRQGNTNAPSILASRTLIWVIATGLAVGACVDGTSPSGGETKGVCATGQRASGTFGLPQRVPLGGGELAPAALGAGDLDGDGSTDLVVIHFIGGDECVEVHRGLSCRAARFSDAERAAIPGGTASDVEVADVDGDGLVDLLVGTADRIALFHGHQGTEAGFSEPLLLEGGELPQYVELADMDGDGYDDIVTVNHYQGAIRVLRQTSSGFELGAPVSAGGGRVADIEVADLDSDGDLDVAGAQYQDDRVVVWLNQGGGELGEPSTYPVATAIPDEIAIGDLTGDGAADLVVRSRYTRMRLLPGDPAAPGRFTPEIEIGSLEPVAGIRLADVDDDGFVDLITSRSGPVGESGAVLSVFRTRVGGALSAQPGDADEYDLQGETAGPVQASDVDGDGVVDIIVLTAGAAPALEILAGRPAE